MNKLENICFRLGEVNNRLLEFFGSVFLRMLGVKVTDDRVSPDNRLVNSDMSGINLDNADFGDLDQTDYLSADDN